MANLIRASASYPFVALLIFQATVNSVFVSPAAENPALTIDSIEDPEDIANQTKPSAFQVLDDWADWESWKASPDIVEGFPYYKLGHDLDGLLVTVVEFGKWNYRELAKKPKEKLDEFWKYFEQFLRREAKDAEVNNGEGMVLICDWEGFSLNRHASKEAIKLVMKLFAGLVRLNHVLKYGFYVNVDFGAETFINLMRPFVGEYLEKFDICGTRIEKCKPAILKKIGADQLPPKYGGTRSQ